MNAFPLWLRLLCSFLLLSAVCALPAGDVHAATFYVKTNGNDVAAGTSWATAKQTIQAAVNLAVDGDTVLVSNGTYSTGTAVTPDFITSNRVVITNNILVKSVNGATTTTIRGQDNGNTSPTSVRCVYMSSGTLVGFRLTQGRAPLVSTNDAEQNIWGGGAYAVGGTIEDCIINANDAFQGGGVYGGTLQRCTISGNGANNGGGARSSSLIECIISGNSGSGASDSYLQGCTVMNNSSIAGGGLSGGSAERSVIKNNTALLFGGTVGTFLYNCLIISNSATEAGGGATGGYLENCTVAYNTAQAAGGVYAAPVYNSIVYFNGSTGTNVSPNHLDSEFYYSCTTPAPTSGANNITGNPLFRASGDYRLMTNSPCLNAGNNSYVSESTDIDGNPRIESGTVDMGAYEDSRTKYVSPNGGSIFPYSRWIDAATNIQTAVDAAAVGERVVVTNGIYDSGTRVTPGYQTSNRLVVTKNIQVTSVNGPSVTTIKGLNVGNSLTSVRCLYMSSGSLSGFTLAGGYAQGLPPTHGQNRDGGGAYMTGGSLSNCWIVGNVATSGFGGGVKGGTLYDCQILNNLTSSGGGGVYQSSLFDCTLSGNVSLIDGGGAYDAALTRCQITGNTASNLAGGVFAGTMGNCLVRDNTSVGAVGGAFVVSISNCTIIGNSASNVGGVAYCTVQNSIVYDNTDLAGNPNLLGGTNIFSCIWPNPGGAGNITNNPRFETVGSALLATNSPCINAGSNTHAANPLDLGKRTRIVDGIVDMGAYEFNTYPIHYVAPGGASIPPYSSWSNAATSIQDAIDVANPGELVLVSNGVYNTGSRLTPGFASSNRIVMAKDITVRSVNGPQVTIIEGFDAGQSYGSVRCVYMTAGILSGFTLRKGTTPGLLPYGYQWENAGGGAYMAGGSVERCIITGNRAYVGEGGGVYGGIANACIIRGNQASLGGGAYNSTLNNCAVYDNSFGGGTAYCTLINCSVVDNIAYQALTAGALYGTVYNSIVYHNTLVTPAFGGSANYYGSTFYNSCTTPMPSGSQNITNNPLMVNYAAGNLRLMSNSPCINNGANNYVVGSVDAGGNARIFNGIVDRGAYEFFIYSPSGYWAWAAAITNGMTNITDSATGDGYPNLLKYVTGSSATNADDLAALLIVPAGGGADITFNRNTNAVDATIYVEANKNPVNQPWNPVATNYLGSWGGAPLVSEQGAGSVKSVLVENADDTNLLYRLRVTQP